LSLVLLVAVSRCGTDKKKADDEDEGSEVSGDPPGAVPATWDGQTDWPDSAFEVIEE
jgi:hypothetical protein